MGRGGYNDPTADKALSNIERDPKYLARLARLRQQRSAPGAGATASEGQTPRKGINS